jgi:uncharacterized membrane protein
MARVDSLRFSRYVLLHWIRPFRPDEYTYRKNGTSPGVPHPKWAVSLTGILEILGAIGLVVPESRRLAGICLIAFVIAVIPS